MLEDVYEEAIVSGHITLKGIMHRQLRLEVGTPSIVVTITVHLL